MTDLQKAAYRSYSYALKSGVLVPASACERCQKTVKRRLIHGHHEDYTKPLDVIWLCVKCHRRRHSELDRERGVKRTRNQTPALFAYDVELMRQDMIAKNRPAEWLARRTKLPLVSVQRFLSAPSHPCVKAGYSLSHALGYTVRRYLISKSQQERVA